VLRLSVLDQSPIRAGGTAADAVAETLELAQACDRWGYHRYWLAEHHASRGLAGSTPEVLIAHIAAQTSHLKARLRSYQLLAEVFGLPDRSSGHPLLEASA
jgi:hypothetical protein